VSALRLVIHEETDPVEKHLHRDDGQDHSHQPLGSLQAVPSQNPARVRRASKSPPSNPRRHPKRRPTARADRVDGN